MQVKIVVSTRLGFAPFSLRRLAVRASMLRSSGSYNPARSNRQLTRIRELQTVVAVHSTSFTIKVPYAVIEKRNSKRCSKCATPSYSLWPLYMRTACGAAYSMAPLSRRTRYAPSEASPSKHGFSRKARCLDQQCLEKGVLMNAGIRHINAGMPTKLSILIGFLSTLRIYTRA